MSLYFQGWGVYFVGWGSTTTAPGVVMDTHDGGRVKPTERKRDDIAADIRAALHKLEDTTIAAKVIARTEAVPVPRFEPAQTRLDEAMGVAQAMVERVSSRIQRTQLQIALAAARDVQQQLQAREEAARAIVKARRKRAVAFLAVVLGEDE